MTSNSRPCIGICPGFRAHNDPEIRLGANYYEAVERAGGAPLVLPTTERLDLVPELLARVDGLLLTGGGDLDPSSYGQAAHPATRPVDPRRQAFDLCALREAEEMRLPVLAVCLGIQVVNVARGGDLIQHLPSERAEESHTPPDGQPDLFHTVVIEPGTLLAAIMGAGPRAREVNSSHHQAIGRVGRGLAVSARAPDGVVEAVEDPRKPFFLGVQWHPERLADRPDHLALFQALVRSSRRG
jgi:gamma-glutamyl-gamma-aminobutyrate hydrolase PuuD